MKKSLENTKIIFMGTPEFAKTILAKLHESKAQIMGVFAQPDKPVGRHQELNTLPVAQFAKENNLALYQPPLINNENSISIIRNSEPDYIVVAAYGKFLPEAILTAAKKECLNVHASLLPKYRGAAPINYALLKDEHTTGVSIMRMVREMDAGPVFHTKEINITDDDTASTLTEKLAQLGAETLLETLHHLNIEKATPQEQNPSQVTFAPKLTRELSEIHWQNSSRVIFNQIRALVPWPVASTQLKNQTLKIFQAQLLSEQSGETPGQITCVTKEGIFVATADHDLLITEVQWQGKKRMSAFDLANGLRLKAGEILFGQS